MWRLDELSSPATRMWKKTDSIHFFDEWYETTEKKKKEFSLKQTETYNLKVAYY